MSSRTQIIATIGPASESADMLKSLIEQQVDVIRFNFEWFEPMRSKNLIALVRKLSADAGRPVRIMADLPGPRVQLAEGHTYNDALPFAITARDEEMVRLCVEERVEYMALSFIGRDTEVDQYRALVTKCGGTQKLIAKIERRVAVDAADSII